MPAIGLAEFHALVDAELPFARQMGLSVVAIGRGTAEGRLSYQGGLLRPGGTLAGPALMALADVTMYAVTLSLVGRVPLAVTTNLNINFLRRPGPGDVRAEARALKGGKRLIVMDCTLYSEGLAEPVAHATGTYSVPPRPRSG